MTQRTIRRRHSTHSRRGGVAVLAWGVLAAGSAVAQTTEPDALELNRMDDGTADALVDEAGLGGWYNVDLENDLDGESAVAIWVDTLSLGGQTIDRLGIYPDAGSNDPDLFSPLVEWTGVVVPQEGPNGVTAIQIPETMIPPGDWHVAAKLDPADTSIWLTADCLGPDQGRSFFSSDSYLSGGNPLGGNLMLGVGTLPQGGPVGSLLIDGRNTVTVLPGDDVTFTYYGADINEQFLFYYCPAGVPLLRLLPGALTRTGIPFFPGPVPRSWQITAEVPWDLPPGVPLEFCAIYKNSNDQIVIGPASTMVVSPSVQVAVEQVDFLIDGVPTNNSAWGAVTLDYTGYTTTRYFNMSIDGRWEIENEPILSIEGPGINQSVTMNVDLGVTPGTLVTSVDVGYCISGQPIDDAPEETLVLPVTGVQATFETGRLGGTTVYTVANSRKGDKVDTTKKAENACFPNQECGVAECTPASVSNSLKFLKKAHKKPDTWYKDDDLTIDKMKPVTDWNNGSPDGWWDTKKEKTKGKVRTTISTSMEDAWKALSKNKDIEVDTDNHNAALVGIQKLENGKWKLWVAHDTEQGDDNNGTKVETCEYDPNTGKLTGAKWFDGKTFNRFIIEEPICN